MKSKSAWARFTVWVPVKVKGRVRVLTTLKLLCYEIPTQNRFLLSTERKTDFI